MLTFFYMILLISSSINYYFNEFLLTEKKMNFLKQNIRLISILFHIFTESIFPFFLPMCFYDSLT